MQLCFYYTGILLSLVNELITHHRPILFRNNFTFFSFQRRIIKFHVFKIYQEKQLKVGDFDGVGRDLSDVKRNMCLDVHIAHFNVYFDEISEINWANIFFPYFNFDKHS